jgi:spermidine/putrescine transport system permease protein
MIGRLLRGGFMTAIYAYLYIPIIILIVNSFNSSRFGINWQGFTTNWYSLLMNNDSLLQAAQHSLTMAIFSATFATLIGSLTAVALYRYRFRGKPFVSGMLFVVMMSPDIVMAISCWCCLCCWAYSWDSGRCCFPTSPSACRLWW